MGYNFTSGTPKIRIYQHASTTVVVDGPAYSRQNVNTSTGYSELVVTWAWSYNGALLTPSDVTVYYP